MRWLRKAAVIPAVLAMVLFSGGAQASANVGWIYTLRGSGYSTSGAYFDSDLNGHSGVEKVTVCDNESDGRGVVAKAREITSSTTYWVYDTSNNGSCSSESINMFPEDTAVIVDVCEYAGSNLYNCSDGIWVT